MKPQTLVIKLRITDISAVTKNELLQSSDIIQTVLSEALFQNFPTLKEASITVSDKRLPESVTVQAHIGE